LEKSTHARVLITGGAGFIGSRLAGRLAGTAERIVVFDSLHPQVHGSSGSCPPFAANVEFIRGDMRDAAAVNAAVAAANAGVIYHLAAETGTGQSYDEPARYCAVNVLGTAHLIEAVRAFGKKQKRRIVLAGSRAVYGEGAYKTRDGRTVNGTARSVAAMRGGQFDPVDENGDPLAPAKTQETLSPSPASVYASTKLMQEQLLAQCAQAGDFDVAILRFQNVYGPGQSLTNPYTGVLSIFAAQILEGRTLNIFEDGEITRDFVYVDDVVEALILAGCGSKPPAGPVNIGSGEPATIRRCAEILLERLGSGVDRLRVTGDFRAGDIRHAVADIAKAEQSLGWRPKTPLAAGLDALAAWVKASHAAN